MCTCIHTHTYIYIRYVFLFAPATTCESTNYPGFSKYFLFDLLDGFRAKKPPGFERALNIWHPWLQLVLHLSHLFHQHTVMAMQLQRRGTYWRHTDEVLLKLMGVASQDIATSCSSAQVQLAAAAWPQDRGPRFNLLPPPPDRQGQNGMAEKCW